MDINTSLSKVSEQDIFKHVHVNHNTDGDCFVGIKADFENVMVYFPIGYQLPKTDKEVRKDIRHLIQVLSEFTTKYDRLISMQKFTASQTVDFPINAYRTVIEYYLDTGNYYIETDPVYKTSQRGNQHWPKTLKNQMPLVQTKNGVSNFIFTQFTVRSVALNDSKKITQINKYCVSEALAKMGWLYIPMEPGPEEPHPDVKTSIRIVTDKMASTFDDKKRSLFQAMKDMLVYIDEATMEKNFYFGTDNFDHVWEKLIDKAFGIRDKNKYFPRARWLLDYGKYKEKYPLQPDTIMIYKNKYYVLDAKCYKYGRTGSPNDLPDSSSINKQITYGEYLRRTMGIQNDCLYNAFILPFNKSENIFDITENIGTIGEAVGDWRENLEYYERIQGIVLDTRHLMYAYLGNPVEDKEALAECIEMVKKRNPVPSAPGSVKPILTPVSYLNKSFNGSLGLVAENTAYGGQNIEHSTRALGDE